MSGHSRREFLQAGALAGVGFFVAGAAQGQRPKKERAKVERLKFACVGVGGKGGSDTDHVGELGDVVALCDIDENKLNAKAQKFSKAKKFFDFREMRWWS